MSHRRVIITRNNPHYNLKILIILKTGTNQRKGNLQSFEDKRSKCWAGKEESEFSLFKT